MAKTCPYIDLPYLDFLEGYRFDPSEVHIKQIENDVEVTVEGLWYRTILWEVPLLALISELHYEMNHLERNSNEIVIENTLTKAEKLNNLGVTYAEFGTRRRHSYKVHDLVIGSLAKRKHHFHWLFQRTFRYEIWCENNRNSRPRMVYVSRRRIRFQDGK